MIGKCSNCDNQGSSFGKIHEEFEDQPVDKQLCVFCGDEAIKKNSQMDHNELDIYGFLKHYRDGLSWSNPPLMAISTADAMNILEKYWREKIAKHIEDLRVDNCRCGLDFIEKSCNLLHEAVLIAGNKEEYYE